MTLASPKGYPTMVAFPRTLSSIIVTVGGLAVFLILASSVLISVPLGFTIRGYFYGVDVSRKSEMPMLGGNGTVIDDMIKLDLPVSGDNGTVIDGNGVANSSNNLDLPMSGGNQTVIDGNGDVIDKNSRRDEEPLSSSEPSIVSAVPIPAAFSSGLTPEVGPITSSESSNVTQVVETINSVSNETSNDTKTGSVDSGQVLCLFYRKKKLICLFIGYDLGCDLYRGHWFNDSSGPLYTNNTCPVLTQMQNCQGNGRPDKEYENWRWKPSQCDLPRFDPKKFLELMRGKTLAFIGDSVARNQMESMLCILWQVEVPRNRGNRRMQRWYFKSTSVMIVRIWSSWLVHKTSAPFDFAPEGVVKLHLDAPDEGFMEFIPNFDVIVLSSGHWFAKQSVYILNNEIVGGQLWWPDKSRHKKIDNIEAFGISVETILTAIATHPNYTGLAIVRSYSPDHYEGGAWNTGGSCTGKVKPASDRELAENGFTNIMHEKQVMGFNRAIKKVTKQSKLRLMDITKAFGYRHDGHPGPYRSPDPNKITKRGPDGKPPPQDCLHWCMPGPVDTWNELVLEIIRREFEGNPSFPP